MNDNELRCWLLQEGCATPDQQQIDLNRRIANDNTPLMHAARMGKVEVVHALLARGADPALMNADSNGALWFACFSNSEVCATALIAVGAPLDSQNVNGATALIYCASTGKTPLLRLLLDAGADPALSTLDEFTALELASNIYCMRMLKEVTEHV